MKGPDRNSRGAKPPRTTLAAARREMLALGMDAGQIAADFVRNHGLRPRAAYRHAHGWTQEQAAEQINLKSSATGDSAGGQATVWASQVSGYEAWPHGGRRPPVKHLRWMALAYRTAVRNLLDEQDREHFAPDDLRSLAPDVLPAIIRRPTSHSHAGAAGQDRQNPDTTRDIHVGDHVRIPRTLEIFDEWDHLMRRRTLLTAGGASAIGMLAPQLITSLPLAGQPTAPEVFHLRAQLTDSYRRLDNLLGAAAVYQQTLDHHRQLVAWRRAVPAAERPRVAMLVADSGALMGWLNTDLEQYAEAGNCYRDAAQAAGDAGDASMYAYLISRMSRVLSDCGLHRDALGFANAADRAARRAHPVVRSWVAVTRAYVHACLNDEWSCRRDLDAAEQLLDTATADGQPPPACVNFFDAVHLRKWTGYSLMRLGTVRWTSAAQAALDQTAAQWSGDFVRGSAEVSTACATARIAQGEIEEAVRWTRRAYDVAARTSSARNLRRVHEARARLTPHARTRAVQELDEYLLTVAGSVTG